MRATKPKTVLAVLGAAVLIGGLAPALVVAVPAQAAPAQAAVGVRVAREALQRVDALPEQAQAKAAAGRARAVSKLAERPVTSRVAVAAVTWPKSAVAPTVLVRTITGGKPSAWEPVAPADADEPGSTAAGSDPIVVVGAERIQIATLADADVPATLAVFESPDGGIGAAAPAAVAPAAQAAPAASGSPTPTATRQAAVEGVTEARFLAATPADAARPAIRTRAQWGADERIVKLPYVTGSVQGALIHHTAGSNTYASGDVPAILRSIQAYHVLDLGWKDIAYNVLVDRFGVAWEGRGGGLDQAIAGGHTVGLTNERTTGLAFIGDFSSVETPSAMLATAQQVVAWKFLVHDVDPDGSLTGTNGTLKAVSGHRDDRATACPGDSAYAQLPAFRAQVRARMDAASAGEEPAPAPIVTSPTLTKTTLAITGVLDTPTVKELQKWVGTTVDGDWGPKTTRALQAKVGATVTGVRDAQTTRKVQALVDAVVDGVWGPATTRALQGYLNQVPVSQYGAGIPAQPLGAITAAPAPAPSPSTSPTPSTDKVILTVNGVLDTPTVKELQKWVGTTPDGEWGPKTTRALQVKVGATVTGVRDAQTTRKVQALVGAVVDGIWGSNTTKALQRYLNAR
nr:hypothetical protein [Propionibacterium sp.]